MKTGKIKAINGDGTWKDLFKFEVEIDNGDIGNMYKKSDNPFVEVGQEINYTLSDKGTLKIIEDGGSPGTSYSYTKKDDVQRYIIRQSCLNRAVDIHIATQTFSEEQILQQAERFEQWVLTKNVDNNSKDLPFSDYSKAGQTGNPPF